MDIMEGISSFLVKEYWKQWVCEHYQCSEHLQDHTVYRNNVDSITKWTNTTGILIRLPED